MLNIRKCVSLFEQIEVLVLAKPEDELIKRLEETPIKEYYLIIA